MTPTAKKILTEALCLPHGDREALIDALSDSLEAVGQSRGWQAEIADRIRRIESGDAVFVDVEQHLRDMRNRYREAHR